MRCEILHMENTHTIEARTRIEALELLKQYRKQWWTFNHKDRKLLTRDDKFFKTSPLQTIEFWIKQIKLAYQRSLNIKKDGADIRNFLQTISICHKKKRKRASSPTQSNKKKKQMSVAKFLTPNQRNILPNHKKKRMKKCQQNETTSNLTYGETKIKAWIRKYNVKKKMGKT